jgi:hypothetical protein
VFHDRYKYIRAALNNKTRVVIKTDRFIHFKMFKAFKNIESEIGDKVRKSEYDEMEGKIRGEALLYNVTCRAVHATDKMGSNSDDWNY